MLSPDPVVRMYQLRDAALLEEHKNYRKPPVRFRASELSECRRRVWYRLSGYVPKPRTGFDDDWAIDGDVHHDIVRQMLLANGAEIAGVTQNDDGTTEEDSFIVHEFNVDGMPVTISTRQDGWIKHDEHGWMLLEIKSVSHWKHTYIVKAYEQGGDKGLLDYLIDKYPNYIWQMTMGMRIAQERGRLPFDVSEKHTLTTGYLLFKDRSNCHIGLHTSRGLVGGVLIEYDQELAERILRRLAKVKSKVLDGVPPLPEYPPGHQQCKYCKFCGLCHGATKGGSI